MRTIESLQYLLHGLYPDATDTSKHSEPKVNVQSLYKDTMIPQASCASVAVELGRLREHLKTTSTSFTTEAVKPLSFWHNMEDHVGDQAYKLYDMISCHLGSGASLPPTITSEHYGRMEGLVINLWYFTLFSFIQARKLRRV